jgi:hypothetical protein
MALEAILGKPSVFRIVLEAYPEGVYVLVFEAQESQWPCQDHLQDDRELAKLHAREEFGVSEDMWREIPDTHVMDQN